MVRIVFLGFLMLAAFSLKSQSTRDVGPPKPPPPQYQSNKKMNKGFTLSRFFKKKEKTEVEEFRERVSESYKARAKLEKKSDKPQFKDPTYFGHKKPPKKRPPGRQKFCKECGMKH
ncbi:MAG: hypothetical protein ACO2ZZ_13445 [Cyclobacteriaceae bacterium]|jgi:hypothetical protein